MTPADLRQHHLLLRDSLTALERQAMSLKIWERLYGLAIFQAASQALFYVSSHSEVETSAMRSMARENGMRVCVPRSDPATKRMVFYDLPDDKVLRPGPYGILEPPDDPDTITDLENPSIILVPGLVFDPSGARLGWGKGYYDRFLGGEGRGIPSVGLAFEIQIGGILPQQAHDVPLRWIVTETRVIDCGERA